VIIEMVDTVGLFARIMKKVFDSNEKGSEIHNGKK
jgi:hypothetical protein